VPNNLGQGRKAQDKNIGYGSVQWE